MPRIFSTSGKESVPRIPDIQKVKFVEGRINKGMITMIDPADLDPAALQYLKNATVRFDKTTRRPGSSLMTPVKPNTEPVLKLAFIKKKDGSPFTLRMTPSTIHRLNNTPGWTDIVFTPPLTGGVKDRFNTADILDNFIFSNNGADPIQTIDFGTDTGAPLGDAPNFRYVTGFYNRAVGLALKDTNEVLLGWSADGDATIWNPATNESAGEKPLLESPADLSDFIKGGFAFTNVMVILREKSIWLATKQPIPQDPFYCYSAVPGIGCDCPFSAQVIAGGLAWIDRRTGTVYAYQPGQAEPEAIGRSIEKTILKNVDDPETVFGAYAPIPGEYSVYIPGVGSDFIQEWKYNFRTKAWSYNEIYDLASANDSELATAGTTIDELGDVPIESLVGDIDSLSPSSAIITTRAYGRGDGTIMLEDVNEDKDAPHTDFPNGIEFDTVLTSKCFVMPTDDMYIAQINIEYQAERGGSFTIEYSKNGGATDASWKVAKTVTPNVVGSPILLILKKVVKARRFAWRLTTRAGDFSILSYEVHVYPSGMSAK